MQNRNDLMGVLFDLILNEIWLKNFQVKRAFPKVLLCSRGHGNELATRNLRGRVEFIDRGKWGNEVLGRKEGWKWEL